MVGRENYIVNVMEAGGIECRKYSRREGGPVAQEVAGDGLVEDRGNTRTTTRQCWCPGRGGRGERGIDG